MKLLFISNLFPDTTQPIWGLDNATLLHSMPGDFEFRVISPRFRYPWHKSKSYSPREIDVRFQPLYTPVRYIPKISQFFNHRLFAEDLRAPLVKVLDGFDPDAILVSWVYPDGCALARLKSKGIFKQHLYVIAQGTDIHTYLNYRTRRKTILESLDSMDALITRSADLTNRLKEAGADGKNLYPVHNGIDTETFHLPRLDEGPHPLLAENCRNVVFVGNLLPVKNPEAVIRVFASACAHIEDTTAKLLMIGEGPLRATLNEYIKGMGLEDRVQLPGRIPVEGVAHVMRHADALLMASHNEGVPNVVLEAFASGLPVVCTDVGGIHEVHTGETLGALRPAGDEDALSKALADILQNPPDRKSIRAHGENFTWDRCAKRYLEIMGIT